VGGARTKRTGEGQGPAEAIHWRHPPKMTSQHTRSRHHQRRLLFLGIITIRQVLGRLWSSQRPRPLTAWTGVAQRGGPRAPRVAVRRRRRLADQLRERIGFSVGIKRRQWNPVGLVGYIGREEETKKGGRGAKEHSVRKTTHRRDDLVKKSQGTFFQ
jgi:hypothetical protein